LVVKARKHCCLARLRILRVRKKSRQFSKLSFRVQKLSLKAVI